MGASGCYPRSLAPPTTDLHNGSGVCEVSRKVEKDLVVEGPLYCCPSSARGLPHKTRSDLQRWGGEGAGGTASVRVCVEGAFRMPPFNQMRAQDHGPAKDRCICRCRIWLLRGPYNAVLHPPGDYPRRPDQTYNAGGEGAGGHGKCLSVYMWV